MARAAPQAIPNQVLQIRRGRVEVEQADAHRARRMPAAIHRVKAGIGALGSGGPMPQHPMGVLRSSAMQAKGVFPFRFGREPGISPAGIGIRFEPAQVPHLCLGGAAAARQGEFVVIPPSVERCLPMMLLHQGPAFTHLQLGSLRAPIGDEAGVVDVAHQAAFQLNRLQPHPEPRRLVVDLEPFALVADLRKPDGAGEPLLLLQGQLSFKVLDGFQRLAVETIQEIHQKQFLVLLLILQARLHQGLTPFSLVPAAVLPDRHPPVDTRPAPRRWPDS